MWSTVQLWRFWYFDVIKDVMQKKEKAQKLGRWIDFWFVQNWWHAGTLNPMPFIESAHMTGVILLSGAMRFWSGCRKCVQMNEPRLHGYPFINTRSETTDKIPYYELNRLGSDIVYTATFQE
jgi:hypothetical protein